MMERILVTGGSGTLGRAVIRALYPDALLAVYSRSEAEQARVRDDFPGVACHLGAVEDPTALGLAYDKFAPSVVVHAAAMKHVDRCEEQPVRATAANVVGSLNVIELSIRHRVPVTLGVSTDKACEPSNVYGRTKALMERMFLEADNGDCRFACVRLGNIAGSRGSVIPHWRKLAAEGKPLPVTHPAMRRFFCTREQAAGVVVDAIEACRNDGGFIAVPLLRAFRIGDLAAAISGLVVVTGPRPGERNHECMISEAEVPYTRTDGQRVTIRREVQPESTRIAHAWSTESDALLGEARQLL